MLHRIFDELEGTTVFLSVRDVCQQLRAAADNYHRYALDFTSLSKADFHRLLPLVRPECVTALSLSDEIMTPGQIATFRSHIDISLFTRLRSLTLRNIARRDLCSILKHAKRCSLTSLNIHSTVDSVSDEKEIAHHLSSILGQPSLLRLALFLSGEPSRLMCQLEGPLPCKLRYLRVTLCMGRIVSKMITSSPDLETLVLHQGQELFSLSRYTPEEWFPTPCPRLTSLTLLNFSVEMGKLQSALSQTPSLRHLKIIGSSRRMKDGSQWEELIKTKLPFLDNYEFYTHFYGLRSEKETAESILNELIAPFCTSFWTKEKRWLVICNFFSTVGEAEIYTSPICTSSYTHVPGPKTMTISNFEREDQHPTVLEAVDELRVNLSRISVDDRVGKFHHSTTLLSGDRDLN